MPPVRYTSVGVTARLGAQRPYSMATWLSKSGLNRAQVQGSSSLLPCCSQSTHLFWVGMPLSACLEEASRYGFTASNCFCMIRLLYSLVQTRSCSCTVLTGPDLFLLTVPAAPDYSLELNLIEMEEFCATFLYAANKSLMTLGMWLIGKHSTLGCLVPSRLVFINPP